VYFLIVNIVLQILLLPVVKSDTNRFVCTHQQKIIRRKFSFVDKGFAAVRIIFEERGQDHHESFVGRIVEHVAGGVHKVGWTGDYSVFLKNKLFLFLDESKNRSLLDFMQCTNIKSVQAQPTTLKQRC